MVDVGLPSITFDYAQQGNLTGALLTQAQECLAMAQVSQRPLVEAVRGLHKNRGSDSSFTQVLRIVCSYVRVHPLDFQEMVRVLGGIDQAFKYLPGCVPPPVVFKTMERLRAEGTADSICQGYWMSVLDMIEGGEDNEWMYVSVCLEWIYTMRGLKPGYKVPSKALVLAGR